MTQPEGRIEGLYAGGQNLSKEPHASVFVDPLGAKGDRHYGRSPERALLLVTSAHYEAIAEQGIQLPIGALGENVVASGLPANLAVGTQLMVGDTECEVTGVCTVCSSLSVLDPRLPKLAYQQRGVYLSVMYEGHLKVGDPVRILFQPPEGAPKKEPFQGAMQDTTPIART